MSRQLAPTVSTERIQSLDILRGFSLLGIFLVNMINFHSPSHYYSHNPTEWWKYGDLTVYMWLDVLVQASFYPIFAMMFGYGMVIMRERTIARGGTFWKISIRRLLILLIIGILHAFLVWHGDVLITYAVMGILLIFMLKIPGQWLMTIGAIVYLIPQFLLSTMMILVSFLDSSTLADFTDIARLQQSAEVYANGTFLEITEQRISDWSYGNNVGGFILYLFIILPLMMIGAGAAKLNWLEKAKNQKVKWSIIFAVFLVLGLAVKLLPIYFDNSASTQYVQDMIGGPLLAISYIALIVLLTSANQIKKLFKPLASAGRMSITIYLTQSIISTLIFYNYGLGLYGEISMSSATWLAIAIFIIQVIVAEIWLMKFKYGPVEKIWRLLTYGRLKTNRSDKNETRNV